VGYSCQVSVGVNTACVTVCAAVQSDPVVTYQWFTPRVPHIQHVPDTSRQVT